MKADDIKLIIDIDEFSLYITHLKVLNSGKIRVKILPDDSLPSYFTDEYIGEVVANVIKDMSEDDNEL